MNKNRIFFGLATIIVALIIIFVSGRIQADDGTVVIQSIDGNVSRVIRPAHGSVSTLWTTGEKYYVYNLQTRTHTVDVSGTSKEGAAFKIKLFVIYKPLPTDESIRNYFVKYGFSEKGDAGIVPILSVYLNNQVVKELVKYSAYDIAASLNTVQTDLINASKADLAEQFMAQIETLYFIDRPIFDDPKIEAAAAEAVAKEKLKAAGISPKKEQPAKLN
jgi:hypothetical protein